MPRPKAVDEDHHDTIGMISVEANGRIAIGTSTNGAAHRIPGRVGDTAIPGAGGYASSKIGAAVATGDGDIIMRFLLSFQVTKLMELGMEPGAACEEALKSVKQTGKWSAALVAYRADGLYGAACVGFDNFQYCIHRCGMDKLQVISVPCMQL